jgi:peptide chain release factor 1
MDMATADGDSEKLVALRKKIANMGIYAKLFGDFQSLLKEMQACRELLAEDDKEIKKMAEDDLASLQEQLEDLQIEIEDEVIPKRSIDTRDVTLEIR